MKKWNLAATDECTFCKTASETIVHLFWQCHFTQKFWKDLNEQYATRIDSRIDLDTVICGSPNPLICTLTFIAKRYIYECKHARVTPNIRNYNYKVDYTKNTEFEIAKKNGSVTRYLEKWEPLNQ